MGTRVSDVYATQRKSESSSQSCSRILHVNSKKTFSPPSSSSQQRERERERERMGSLSAHFIWAHKKKLSENGHVMRIK